MCARGIPVVSSLAAAISDVGLDGADHPLDCQHFPDLRHVAFAHTGASMGVASCLGHAAGIRVRGSGGCDSRFATEYTIGCISMPSGPGKVKVTAAHAIPVSESLCPSSNTSSVQFTEERIP